jgi:hypothetical protein
LLRGAQGLHRGSRTDAIAATLSRYREPLPGVANRSDHRAGYHQSRAHFALKQAETLAQGYRDELADLDARIQAIAPDLQLPARLRKPNLVFSRGELPRLTLTMLRTAGRPLAIREMALGVLAAKGIRFPDRRTMKRTRVRLREVFAKLQARGVGRGRWGPGRRRGGN